MSCCIVYLASPRDVEFSFGKKLTALQRSIAITKQVFPNTDIIVFHEDLLENDLPNYVKLVKIDFNGFEKYHEYNHRYGYLMMCRFFSGILQNHECLEKYTHYMRLDDDSYFIHPCNIDLNSYMKYDYVYRSTFYEEGHDQTKLYKFTESFLHKRNLYMNSFDKRLAPYNNFHISSLKLWRHPLVKEYIEEIENNYYILKDGFLDANIHAFIIWSILPNTDLKVKYIDDFGYRHNHHVSPKGILGYIHMPNVPYFPPHTNIETIDELKKY